MAGNPVGVPGVDRTCLPPNNTLGRLPAEVLFLPATAEIPAEIRRSARKVHRQLMCHRMEDNKSSDAST